MNVLHLVPDFNYTDGRSYYVYLLSKYLKRAGVKVIVCTNGGDAIERFNELNVEVLINPNLTNKFSILGSVQYLSEIIRSHKIQIMHSHHRYLELLAVMSSKNQNVHTVSTALSIVDTKYHTEYKSEKLIV